MDNIHFNSHSGSNFINELRESVKNYFETKQISRYGNTSLVIKSLVMTALYLGPLCLMLTGVITLLPGILAGWFLMGIGMAGVGMTLMHDANHGTYSKNSKINRILSKSLYLLGGFPPTWQYQHNTLHHGFTNIDGHDEDIAPIGLLRFSPHKPLHKFHKFQYLYAWFFYGLMTISWATIKDFKQIFGYKNSGTILNSNKTFGQMLFILISWKIIYYFIFLMLPLLILPVSWYWILASFFLMHFTSGLILGIIFQTAHVVTTSKYPLPDETGTIENSWAMHQLLTTSDFAPKSRIFSWMIGGLNYQVEHHLFPNISHVHYHNIAYLVKGMANKYSLPYHVQPSFFSALGNHAKMLKQLGRNPED